MLVRSEPSYYMKHYFSNHFKWKNGFDKEQRYRVEGEVFVPFTGTTLSAGVENITKYLYFNDNALASQHSGNVQVFSATLNQNFRFGIFNWYNSVVYQKSSNEKILPLPEISVYSQMYLKFRLAKVLHTQLGTDVHYFTKYYSPVYQPGILTFHTQQDYKVGNYPLMNVYANFKLKDTR